MAGSSQLRAAENAYREDAVNSEKEKVPLSLYAIAVLLFCVDRVLKATALAGVSFGARGAVEFTLFLNTGIAFSIQVPVAFFWVAAPVALTFLGWSFMRAARTSPRSAAIIFCIIAGAISNLMDRITHGATVDYILFFGMSAVNLADAMIVGGLIMLALLSRGASRGA